MTAKVKPKTLATSARPCTRVASFTLNGRHIAVLARNCSWNSDANTTPQPAPLPSHFQLDEVMYFIVLDPPAKRAAERGTADRAPNPPIHLLSGRELQIGSLVAQGLLNKQIADQLRISEWTVCAHLRRIFAKLGVSNRASMVYKLSTTSGDMPERAVVRAH